MDNILQLGYLKPQLIPVRKTKWELEPLISLWYAIPELRTCYFSEHIRQDGRLVSSDKTIGMWGQQMLGIWTDFGDLSEFIMYLNKS